MKNAIFILLLPLLLLVLPSCNEEKNNALTAREQALLEKEKLFALKEADYQSLLRLRDSLAAQPTSLPLNDSLPEALKGSWTGKLLCTESNCPDHVIGDQRTDTWEISRDSISNRIVAKVINNNNLVRVYSGSYDGNQLNLEYKTDSSASRQTEMFVVLNDIGQDKVRGTRDIIINSNCKARFSLELERPKK